MRRLHRTALYSGLVLLVIAMSGGCSADVDVGEVVVHNWDPAAGEESPWIGLIWAQSADGEVLFFGEPTSPRGLADGTPMGYFVNDSLRLSSLRGLFVVTDSSSDDGSATVEMVWTSGLAANPQAQGGSAELDAVLEREATPDLSFFLDCQVFETGLHAVAIVDADLNPVRAWKLVASDTQFVSVLPIHVECNQTPNN